MPQRKFRGMAWLLVTFLLVGSLFAFAGGVYGFDPDTDLSNADASCWGEDSGDVSGYSVASAGDVNGDGYDDFLIGAHQDDDGGDNAGQSYLILGREAAEWGMDFDLSGADASFWGEDSADYSGFSVASAGDVNGDGYDDFLIGAYQDEDGGSNAGQSYLILGREAADWGMDFDLSGADASFWGEDVDDYSGLSVASAGDVNGDGYDDFLIGAYADDDGGGMAGQSYLILGREAADWGMDFDLSNADASFWGEDSGDRSGRSVASAGDVNGDGYDDFLIGAYYDDDGGSNAGQSYLILGTPPPAITGVTGEVNCNMSPGILTGATVDLYKNATHVATTVSDGDGNYSLPVTATGDYEVKVNKSGYREETQAINIPSPGLGPQYELDFLGETGLIPNAPTASYAMDCVNHWLFPPSPECGLSASRAMDVVNAWLFPV